MIQLEDLIGKRVRLIEMPGDPDPVPVGSVGTIRSYCLDVGGSTQFRIDWDNGRTLCIISPPDVYEVITE